MIGLEEVNSIYLHMHSSLFTHISLYYLETFESGPAGPQK